MIASLRQPDSFKDHPLSGPLSLRRSLLHVNLHSSLAYILRPIERWRQWSKRRWYITHVICFQCILDTLAILTMSIQKLLYPPCR